MESIQGILEEILETHATAEIVLAAAIESQLSDRGIKLTKVQKKAIREHLAKRDPTFSLQFKDYQVPARLAKEAGGKLSVDMKDLEARATDIMGRMSEQIHELLPELAESAVDIVFRNIGNRKKALQAMMHAKLRECRKDVSEIWGPAIDQLELMVGVADEAGQNFTSELLKGKKQPSRMTEVTALFLARGCQISSEIVCLLREGFADGAHARWRCLHEMAIVLMFITDNGEQVADKYLLHEGIETYKAALQYQKHCQTLGYLPIPDDDLERMKRNRDRLIERFGKGFDSDYGWASGANNKERPNFSDIEQLVDMSHYRPYYRLASHNVHAGSKGMVYRLGRLPEDQHRLLTGPSAAGLADPGKNTAQSLAMLAARVLSIAPTMDDIVCMKLLHRLCMRTVDAFIAAHDELEGEGDD